MHWDARRTYANWWSVMLSTFELFQRNLFEPFPWSGSLYCPVNYSTGEYQPWLCTAHFLFSKNGVQRLLLTLLKGTPVWWIGNTVKAHQFDELVIQCADSKIIFPENGIWSIKLKQFFRLKRLRFYASWNVSIRCEKPATLWKPITCNTSNHPILKCSNYRSIYGIFVVHALLLSPQSSGTVFCSHNNNQYDWRYYDVSFTFFIESFRDFKYLMVGG